MGHIVSDIHNGSALQTDTLADYDVWGRVRGRV